MRIIVWLVTNVAAVAAAAWLLDGIRLAGNTWQEQATPLLVVGAILGVVNAFVRPVVNVLSLPFIILTLGLFLLVTNALMLLLTAWLADQVDLGFRVDGFVTALLGGIVITIVTWIVDGLIGDR